MITQKCLLVSLIVVLGLLGNQVVAQENENPPLGGWGPHVVGELRMTFVDESREGAQVATTIWYPGLVPEGRDVDISVLQGVFMGLQNAPADMGNAPYPVILFSHGYNGSSYDLPQYTVPLASHGFVVVGIDHRNSTRQATVVDRPLDILFVLNQLSAITEGDLVGLIDTDHVGVFGISDGAYTALTLSGARMNPVSIQALTANPMIDDDVIDPRYWWPE
jgi:predicted dienelactone hydrolase